METTDCIMCVQPALTSRERVRYFPRQLLTADDMRAEQEYFREKQRRHNRFLHGWGVVCGLEVKQPADKDLKWQVTVCPGYALTPQGDEILVTDTMQFDLQTKLQCPEPCAVGWSCPPEETPPDDPTKKPMYLAIRYVECQSRPIRVHPAGCGCDEAACEYSRVRDSFELKALWNLPKSHELAAKADEEWRKIWNNPGSKGKLVSSPMPCQVCSEDPWIVLASIILPTEEETRIVQGIIKYTDRRVLYSTTALQGLLMSK
ncbi:MAG: hypothetical protein ABI604_06110 [Nitrospirota bacterium]